MSRFLQLVSLLYNMLKNFAIFKSSNYSNFKDRNLMVEILTLGNSLPDQQTECELYKLLVVISGHLEWLTCPGEAKMQMSSSWDFISSACSHSRWRDLISKLFS